MKDEILSRIIELLDKGMTPRDILNALPGEREEVKEYLRVIRQFERDKQQVQPSQELFKAILSRVDVTNLKEARLNNQLHFSPEVLSEIGQSGDHQKSRSIININNIREYMNQKLKIILPLGALTAVIVIAAVVVKNRTNDDKGNDNKTVVSTQDISNLKTTDDVDDISETLINISKGEEDLLKQEADDEASVLTDDQAEITNLKNNPYDENDL
jgi:hypothetical protein